MMEIISHKMKRKEAISVRVCGQKSMCKISVFEQVFWSYIQHYQVHWYCLAVFSLLLSKMFFFINSQESRWLYCIQKLLTQFTCKNHSNYITLLAYLSFKKQSINVPFLLRRQEKPNKTNSLMYVQNERVPEVEPAYSVECLQSGL